MGGRRRAGAAVVALAFAAVLGSCGGGGESGPSVDPTRTPTASPTRSATLPSPTRSPIRSDSPTETDAAPEPSDSPADTESPPEPSDSPVASETPTPTPTSAPTEAATSEAAPPPTAVNPSDDDRRAPRRGRGRGLGGRAGLGLVAACGPGPGTCRRHPAAGQVTPEQVPGSPTSPARSKRWRGWSAISCPVCSAPAHESRRSADGPSRPTGFSRSTTGSRASRRLPRPTPAGSARARCATPYEWPGAAWTAFRRQQPTRARPRRSAILPRTSRPRCGRQSPSPPDPDGEP